MDSLEVMLLFLTACIFFVFAPVLANYRQHPCFMAARNLTSAPVCDSLGRTFLNHLEFDCFYRTSHIKGRIVHEGACEKYPEADPCRLRFAHFDPVCATDNSTFRNIWDLNCYANSRKLLLDLEYYGECRLLCPFSEAFSPVCDTAGNFYYNIDDLWCAKMSRPDNNITFDPQDRCLNRPDPCNASQNYPKREVCASNGKTYDNYLEVLCLKYANPEVKILHAGPCSFEDIKSAASNPIDSCIMAGVQPMWLPVCGSDNNTYPNPYVLACRALRDENLTISHRGNCEEDDNYLSATGDDSGACHRLTTSGEIDPRRAICASDGRTYKNLEHFNCSNKHNLLEVVRWNSTCSQEDDPCFRAKVDHQREILCGNDKQTYISKLALLCAMSQRSDLDLRNYGECI